jgi:hypothetical protein
MEADRAHGGLGGEIGGGLADLEGHAFFSLNIRRTARCRPEAFLSSRFAGAIV